MPQRITLEETSWTNDSTLSMDYTTIIEWADFWKIMEIFSWAIEDRSSTPNSRVLRITYKTSKAIIYATEEGWYQVIVSTSFPKKPRQLTSRSIDDIITFIKDKFIELDIPSEDNRDKEKTYFAYTELPSWINYSKGNLAKEAFTMRLSKLKIPHTYGVDGCSIWLGSLWRVECRENWYILHHMRSIGSPVTENTSFNSSDEDTEKLLGIIKWITDISFSSKFIVGSPLEEVIFQISNGRANLAAETILELFWEIQMEMRYMPRSREDKTIIVSPRDKKVNIEAYADYQTQIYWLRCLWYANAELEIFYNIISKITSSPPSDNEELEWMYRQFILSQWQIDDFIRFDSWEESHLGSSTDRKPMRNAQKRYRSLCRAIKWCSLRFSSPNYIENISKEDTILLVRFYAVLLYLLPPKTLFPLSEEVNFLWIIENLLKDYPTDTEAIRCLDVIRAHIGILYEKSLDKIEKHSYELNNPTESIEACIDLRDLSPSLSQLCKKIASWELNINLDDISACRDELNAIHISAWEKLLGTLKMTLWDRQFGWYDTNANMPSDVILKTKVDLLEMYVALTIIFLWKNTWDKEKIQHSFLKTIVVPLISRIIWKIPKSHEEFPRLIGIKTVIEDKFIIT